MKAILAGLLFFLICSPGFVDAMTDQQEELFLNRRSDKDKLYKAIDALGAISEQPDFWIRILGDSHYSLFHRRICEAMLFRRHVSIGMTVGQMKEALHTAQWLSPRDIATPSQSVEVPLPVDADSDSSVFIILFMGTERDEDTGVFIKVSGFLDLPSFKEALLSQRPGRAAGSKILDMGIVIWNPSTKDIRILKPAQPSRSADCEGGHRAILCKSNPGMESLSVRPSSGFNLLNQKAAELMRLGGLADGGQLVREHPDDFAAFDNDKFAVVAGHDLILVDEIMLELFCEVHSPPLK